MSHEIAKTPVDPTQFPEAAHKFAQQALREHQRAEKDVMKAVEHVVKSGQALLKAYDLCEYGQWEGFFEMHFKDKTNPDDGTRPLSLRTGYKYMQLAREWSALVAEHPDGYSSQRQAFKALAAIARAQENRQPTAISGGCAARGASGNEGSGGCAARGASGNEAGNEGNGGCAARGASGNEAGNEGNGGCAARGLLIYSGWSLGFRRLCRFRSDSKIGQP